MAQIITVDDLAIKIRGVASQARLQNQKELADAWTRLISFDQLDGDNMKRSNQELLELFVGKINLHFAQPE